MDVIEALQWRYAVKKFDDTKKLPAEKLDVILEALRLTATSYGLQLMKFVVVEDPEIRRKLVHAAYNQKQVEDASHLIVLCRNTDVTTKDINDYITNIANTRELDEASRGLEAFKNGMMNILNWSETRKEHWMTNQIYITLGNLLTTCAIEKVDACPMEGFIPEKVNEILDLDEHNLSAVLLCPVGYRSEDDHHRNNKKVRKSDKDIIHHIK